MIVLPKKYVDLLAWYGRDLNELGVHGIALPRSAALEAVDALRQARIPILGGDVLREVDGKIRHTYDNWYCKCHADPATDEYAEESFKQAQRYVLAYPDPEDGTVFYEIGVPNR